jgi:hypothetical protein
MANEPDLLWAKNAPELHALRLALPYPPDDISMQKKRPKKIGYVKNCTGTGEQE